MIIYAILGNQCVFTQATRGTNSSINLAEHIIAAVAESEQVDPTQLHFYDLQTHLGYGGPGNYHYPPGVFDYDELEFEMRGRVPNVLNWTPVRCPEEIAKLFAPFIGPNPRQRNGPK